MVILKNHFFKTVYHEDPFYVHFYEGKNINVCGHVETSESDDECTSEVIMKVKSRYVVQSLHKK